MFNSFGQTPTGSCGTTACNSFSGFADCGGGIWRATMLGTGHDRPRMEVKVNGSHHKCLGYSLTNASYGGNWLSCSGGSNSKNQIANSSAVNWYVKVNTGTKNVELSTTDFNCTLPVELISFNAEAEGCQAHLTWHTGSEINNDHFIVEYSYDGSNWKEIDKVNGAGNSTEVIDYSFYDSNCSHNRLVYYRIVQVDFDGTSSNSVVRSLNLAKSKLVKVYPNPTEGNTTIEVNVESGDKTRNVIVKTIAGQTVFSKAIVNGKNKLDLRALAPDTYIIKVSSQNQLPHYEKLVIIK